MSSRMIILLAFGLLAGTIQADDRAAHYQIDFELWLHGESHGSPRMIVEAGTPASMEQGDGDRHWRIEVEVERPAADEYAPEDALWLHLAVYERIEGDWELLADTILGVPEGQASTLTVVEGEGEVEEVTPDNSLVYLRAMTSRVQAGDIPDH